MSLIKGMVLTKTGKLQVPQTIVEIDSKPETNNYTHKGIVFIHFSGGSVYRLHTTNYIPSKDITSDILEEWLSICDMNFVVKLPNNQVFDSWEKEAV
jgi:hypothetical protein